MTNWANFYLVHLATGESEDALTLAIAAYAALRLKRRLHAMAFYIQVLRCLRRLLAKRDPSEISNQEFLRVWSSIVLLIHYEHTEENHFAGAKHLQGATLLCLAAAKRFPVAAEEAVAEKDSQSRQKENRFLPCTSSSPDHEYDLHHTMQRSNCSEMVSSLVTNCSEMVSSLVQRNDGPRNECELPFHLMRVTKLFRAANLAAETIDVRWPQFVHDEKSTVMHGLLLKASECLAHILPLIQDVYIARADRQFTSRQSYNEFLRPFLPRYAWARRCVEEYQFKLDSLREFEFAVRKSTATADFPFSPIIQYINPQMAQVAAMPKICIMLLAPFTSQSDHDQAVRHIAGIFAGRAAIDGLCIEGSAPDLFIASFWKRGAERDYFDHEMRRRRGDLRLSLNSVWRQIDAIQDTQHRVPDKVEILGIALNEWRRAMLDGFKLLHNVFWQTSSWFNEAIPLINGQVDPRHSPYSTAEERAQRKDWPDMRFYLHRVTTFRQNNGWNLSSLKSHERHGGRVVPQSRAIPERMEIPDPAYVEEDSAVQKLEEYDESRAHQLKTTPIGLAAQGMWRRDPDVKKLYLII